jgi:polyhydroxyalkanoate synthesis regulator phasin
MLERDKEGHKLEEEVKRLNHRVRELEETVEGLKRRVSDLEGAVGAAPEVHHTTG